MEVFYQDARATLYRGEALSVLQSLPDRSVDALVTDPPYSSGGAFRGDRMGTTTNKYVITSTARRGGVAGHYDFGGDNRDQRSFLAWCSMWLHEATRVLKPGSPVLLFTDWRQLPTMPLDRGVGALRGVFQHQVYRRDKHHLTGKPTPLMEDLVEIVPPGSVVLDPFAGSGTTLVAAARRGRKSIGVELSEAYCETAARRLASLPTRRLVSSPEQSIGRRLVRRPE